MKNFFNVTSVVRNPEEKILILKKGDDDYNYPGKWSFCSGFIKEFEAGEDTIIREIKEETGLDSTIIKKGGIVVHQDDTLGKTWNMLSFLCDVSTDSVTLCNENSEFKWIDVDELEHYDQVPGLKKTLKALGLMS